MANLNLARGVFQKEHSQKTAATNGPNTFILDDYSAGVVVKVEFQNAAATTANTPIRVVWTARDGVTKTIEEQTATNLDRQGDTIETSARHGLQLTFTAPSNSRKCRIDLPANVTGGWASVWVAAR